MISKPLQRCTRKPTGLKQEITNQFLKVSDTYGNFIYNVLVFFYKNYKTMNDSGIVMDLKMIFCKLNIIQKKINLFATQPEGSKLIFQHTL